MDARGPKAAGGDALRDAVSGAPSLPSSVPPHRRCLRDWGGSWVGVARVVGVAGELGQPPAPQALGAPTPPRFGSAGSARASDADAAHHEATFEAGWFVILKRSR